MLKGLANFGAMMRQAQQMGEKMQEMQAVLRETRVSGAAGGGMIEVEANGLGEVLRVSLEPDLIAKNDRELIEDLIPPAVNQALEKARAAHAELMKEQLGGMNMPGLDEALAKLNGGGLNG